MKLPEKYLLYVGNAYPHKNLEKLLEAISSIKYQVESIKFVFVGAEDYFYKRLKEKVKDMGLGNNVIFYGEVKREELTNLYKNAIALVFPSLMEGFGLPGLEAMVCSCPVVCSDIPVLREIYGEAALYFDPLDAGDITQKIKNVCFYDLNHRNRMIKRGLEQVKKYSWQKMAKETLKVYARSACL